LSRALAICSRFSYSIAPIRLPTGVILDTQNITRPLSEGEESEKQLAPGITLANRYLVEQVIGVGGMGSVYRARDLHFPSIIKLVAVKEMSNQSRDENLRAVSIQNFEREANIIATLSHPAIPRIYDFFTQGEHAYLVLEFIFGKDLEAILNETDHFLTEEQVLKWSIEICEVLNYLHTHKPEPIIFRDVKPSNIMINQHNHVVLVDFGIAKAFQQGQKGTMMGTEGYSPPEQYRGEATQLVDIYALGATLHHLLTRCDPQHEPPFTFSERPIRKYNPAVSPQLEAVINTALEYNPQNRFQSMEEFKTALENVSARKAIVAVSAPPSRSPDAQQGNRVLWTFDCEDEVRGSPAYDEGKIYIGALDNNLYAIDAVNGSFIWKYPTQGAIVGKPVIKERFLYLGSEDTYLHVLTASTGRLVWTYHTGSYVRSSPCLTDNYIFLGSDDGYLHSININSGRKVWQFQTGGPVRSTAAFRNNLIYTGCETGDFYCLDLFGEQKWHFHAKRSVTSSPLLVDDIVLFASMDSTLYAIDAKMGWEIWRFRLGRGSISSPCSDGKTVFLGAADGLIYAIDIDTNHEVWTFKTEHQVNGSPVIYQDCLYCGSVDGSLYCLECRTGRLIWKYSTGKPITGMPLVINDIIYIGSTDHKVYALSI
jgi:eukaryotic-like serine/threonine-protein kinase